MDLGRKYRAYILNKMVVLVCGSRFWDNRDRILNKLKSYSNVTLVVHGGFVGADLLAESAALELGIEVLSFPAEWTERGRIGGPLRNQKILDECKPDLVLAFHENFYTSKSTWDMIVNAGIRKIKYEIIEK